MRVRIAGTVLAMVAAMLTVLLGGNATATTDGSPPGRCTSDRLQSGDGGKLWCLHDYATDAGGTHADETAPATTHVARVAERYGADITIAFGHALDFDMAGTTAPTGLQEELFGRDSSGEAPGNRIEISTQDWNWGSNCVVGVTRCTLQVHTAGRAGISGWLFPEVQFNVTDENGFTTAQYDDEYAVHVIAAPDPTPDFTVTKVAAHAGQFRFTGSAPDAVGATAYGWNLGDGNTASGATITHTYAKPGTYHVWLFARDKNGTGKVEHDVAALAPKLSVTIKVGASSWKVGTSHEATVTVTASDGTGTLGSLKFPGAVLTSAGKGRVAIGTASPKPPANGFTLTAAGSKTFTVKVKGKKKGAVTLGTRLSGRALDGTAVKASATKKVTIRAKHKR